jgi:hypothetical protein
MGVHGLCELLFELYARRPDRMAPTEVKALLSDALEGATGGTGGNVRRLGQQLLSDLLGAPGAVFVTDVRREDLSAWAHKHQIILMPLMHLQVRAGCVCFDAWG